MDMAVEEAEEAGEEVEATEMGAERDGTEEEVEEVQEDTVMTSTKTEEEVDNGTVLRRT